MIAMLSVICVVGIFVAGHVFSVTGVAGLLMLGFFVICQGLLVAAAETRGFEGQRIINMPLPMTWEKLWLQVVRMALDRGKVQGSEPVYVQTPRGPVPVTGVFTARLNHEMSIVLDTEELSDVPIDPTLP